MVKAQLTELIKEKQARVGVVGLGYVGLPLLTEFARAGYEAIGFEVDSRKADQINAGVSYIGDVESSAIKTLVDLMMNGNITEVIRAEAAYTLGCIAMC